MVRYNKEEMSVDMVAPPEEFLVQIENVVAEIISTHYEEDIATAPEEEREMLLLNVNAMILHFITGRSGRKLINFEKDKPYSTDLDYLSELVRRGFDDPDEPCTCAACTLERLVKKGGTKHGLH